MGIPITIHKLNDSGVEVWRYDGIVLSKTPTSLTLEAHFDRDDISLHGLMLRKGDRFVETFYSDRWYNTFTIYDVQNDQLKGWYCNVCRPARIEDGHVFADDLALDLIVYPDGKWLILDEDEFADLELSQEEKECAQEALNELINLARNKTSPFEIP